MPYSVSLTALEGVPLVNPGDDLIAVIETALRESGLQLENGDIIVLAQKIVSKSEGRYVDLRKIEPSPEAIELAGKVDKDPRIVDIILSESAEVIRYCKGVLIVQHKLGFIHANAGIDRSNLPHSAPGNNGDIVLLFPENPDASAAAIKDNILQRQGVNINVIINDSFSRAWRQGLVGIAIGSAGFPPLCDLRGKKDLFGRALEITQVAIADELAAAASLLMGQAGEGTPIVVVKGIKLPASDATVASLIRPKEEDLFR